MNKKKEKQPKKFYWAVVDESGFVTVCSSRSSAEADARGEVGYGADYSHVVKLVPEVVKTVRRKA